MFAEARENVPAAQAEQVRGVVEAVKVPAGQPAEEEKQDVAPGLLLEPAGQGVQSDSEVAAVALLKVLGGHGVGEVDPLPLKLPGGQHTREPRVLPCPEAQGRQEVWPVKGVYLPAGQSWQSA